jgi:hypothetical protein
MHAVCQDQDQGFYLAKILAGAIVTSHGWGKKEEPSTNGKAARTAGQET